MESVEDRLEMSQRERDVLKVMSTVLRRGRTQAEAARLLRRSVRQGGRVPRRGGGGRGVAGRRSGVRIGLGVGGPGGSAQGSWCRWTRLSKSGWRDVGKRWCW